MRRQRSIFPMKERNQTTGTDQSETIISNMPDREFNVMFIKTLTGLEKRVEDISETLNTKMKSKQTIRGQENNK